MQHSKSLNPAQKNASETLDGPVLILAGAGAGKTKTIIERIGNLILKGVSPHQILAITFTNKAASEMRERVEKLLGSSEMSLPISSKERPFVSTFHALCVHILRENSKAIDLPRHFTIYDKSDSKQAVKEALKNKGLDPKKFEPNKILGIISREKGAGTEREEFEEREGGEFMGKVVSSVWKEYENLLKKDNALDFDDLLLETYKLFKKDDVLSKYQDVWKYIHVDEYQDTNKVQYLIAKKLASKFRNICAVGDIDQNIYSWRGARLKNIMDFEKDYPEAKIILLEENYRSSKNIIEVANLIIKKNQFRKDKNLFTKNPTGEMISIFEALDENAEAQFVASKVSSLIKKGVPQNEIAVLYRANFQSRALEEAFISNDLEYQLIGTKFFERKEVKDALSYIRASLNTESWADLKRIINVPARGIGKVSLLKIFEGKESSLPKGTQEKYRDFKNILTRIREKIGKEKTSEVVRFAIKESGLEKMFEGKNEEDLERLENIKELVTLATKYDSLESEEGVEKLLTEAALESDQDDLEKKKNGAKLMTIHASKGLEFDYVFITGLEDGLFPHERSSHDNLTPEESEEERRLFYVALTRARKKVFLSYAQIRTLFGSKQINAPSEFVLDVPDEFLEREEFEYENSKKPLFSIEF